MSLLVAFVLPVAGLAPPSGPENKRGEQQTGQQSSVPLAAVKGENKLCASGGCGNDKCMSNLFSGQNCIYFVAFSMQCAQGAREISPAGVAEPDADI